MTTPYIDPKNIFASNAPAQDKPPRFDNYEKGMDETRKNEGRPTIKQLNYLHQQTDLKILYIHENGAGLPYVAGIEYQEGALILKDGELVQKSGDDWVSIKTKNASELSTANTQTQQELNDSVGAKWYAKEGGYAVNARVMLNNGDIVRNTVANNTNNPNSDMTGWFLIGSDKIRTISTIAELRLTSPNHINEIVFVLEYSTGSIVGGGYFRYAPEMSANVFADDAVINIKNGTNIWTRCNSDGSVVREVPMEWSGVVSTYAYDQSTKVQAVFNAALTLATNRSSTVLSKTRRVSVIPPPKLRCNKTVYFNLTFVQIKGNSSEWSFDSNGTYDDHPTAKTKDGSTPLTMCLVGLGAAVSNTDSVACYRDRVDLSQLNLYLATSYVNDMPQVSKVDSGIIGYSTYSNQNTLRQAQVHLPDVSFIGFGAGFCNGNYSWGYEFDNCKFSENYYATWLIAGEDNGERFSFNHCIMQNNVNALWNNDWEGYITVFGGSYVWNDGEYFHIGKAFGAYLRPNHVEYVTSTSPILTTDDNVMAGPFPKLRTVVWEGGELAISRTNTDVITDKIELVKAGVGSSIYVREQSGYWNSIDYTPNMRIAQDKYPWDTTAGRVYVDNISLSIGTWGVLGRTKSLINTPQTGVLNQVFSTTIAAGAVINWVNNSVNDRYMQFKANAATSTANTLTFNIPLNRVKDFFAIVPACYFDSVSTVKSDWTINFYAYNSKLGFGANTSIGAANLFNGSTEVFPLNQYNRPLQVLKTDLAVFSEIDTIRVFINMPTGWGANDVFNLRAAGAIVI